MGKINENLVNKLKQKEQEKIAETIAKIQNGEEVSREELNNIQTPVEPEWMYDKLGHIIPEKWILWLTHLSTDVVNDELPIEKKVIEHSDVWADLKFARSFIDKNRKQIGDMTVSGTLWNVVGNFKPISLQNGQIELVEQLIDEIVANAIPCTVKEPEPTREDDIYDTNEETNEVLRIIWHTGNGM